jgi:hypothetical protein
MKFLILVKATKDSEAGVMPSQKLLAEMGAYHEELARSGVLVDGNGLIEITKRFPNPSIGGGEAEIEVRPYFELDDFGEGPGIERFRKLEAERKNNR